MFWRINARSAVSATIVLIVLSACNQTEPEQVERIRAIKPYYVSEPAGSDVRRYSGTIAAANTSALSFAVSGTVATVEVNQGDRVSEGQVLATLDPQPFELDVNAAQSELDAARAEFDNAQSELDRQQQLFARGWIAQAALDQAVSAFDAAEGQLNLARSRLGLVERDLTNATLTAPFDGAIAQRTIDPFVEVISGQEIFQLDSEGALEAKLSIPDTIVGRLTVGTPVTLETRTVAGCGCTGRITEIGTVAGAASAVPVTAAILENPAGLLPGTAVEVSVLLADERLDRGYLVPLVAIAPGDDQAMGYVFKFDQDAGQVSRTPVRVENTVSGNLVEVSDGVGAGDVIAAAGVSFLRDGQSVRLMGE